eukprot:12342862-Alexandrium_andersonii.AAC.1
MSASLVGSEMCIRDSRLRRRRSARTGGLGGHLGAGRIQHDTPNGEEGEACLLYTSDAADDM